MDSSSSHTQSKRHIYEHMLGQPSVPSKEKKILCINRVQSEFRLKMLILEPQSIMIDLHDRES